MQVEEAVRGAVQVRFRTIFLTTLAALLGMLPIALGQDRELRPNRGICPLEGQSAFSRVNCAIYRSINFVFQPEIVSRFNLRLRFRQIADLKVRRELLALG